MEMWPQEQCVLLMTLESGRDVLRDVKKGTTRSSLHVKGFVLVYWVKEGGI